MRNKYNNFTFNEIVNEIYMNKDINNIDITINLQILRDIHSILSDMYFSTKKR